MGILYQTTRPIQGDDFNVLLAKLLQRLGGQPQSGDSEVLILRRILELLSGFTPPPDSTAHELVRKILEALHVVDECPEASPGISGGVQWGPDSTEIIIANRIDFEDSLLDSPTITTITFSALVTIDDEGNSYDFQLYLSNTVVAYSFPELVTANVDSLDGGGNDSISSWSSPKLQSVRGNFYLGNNPLTFLDIGALETVGGSLQVCYDCPLESVEYSSLTTVGDFFDVADECPNLTSISAPLIETASGGFFVGDCPLLTSLVFPSLVDSGNSLYVKNCSNLTSLSLPVYVPQDAAFIQLINNALDAASVNAFLARCVANPAFVSGDIDISGGTNAAPTGQGITDKNDLIARGVNVTTN